MGFFLSVFLSMLLFLQVALSLSSTSPVNVSLNLNKQWHNDSSRGQACVLFSAKQVGCAI